MEGSGVLDAGKGFTGGPDEEISEIAPFYVHDGERRTEQVAGFRAPQHPWNVLADELFGFSRGTWSPGLTPEDLDRPGAGTPPRPATV